jgi:cell division protein FtsZ
MSNGKDNQKRIRGEIAVMGIGDFGADMLEKLVFSGVHRPMLFRVNWDDCLPKLQDEYIHISLNSRYRGFTNGDPISASKATAEVVSELIELTLSASLVILIAQPGDGVGSGATTALASIFKNIETPFLSILCLPDVDIVGRKRHMTARSTISELCVMKETPVVFDQADFPGYLKAFKTSVADKIQVLLNALSPGMIPIDFNRIRTALTGLSGSTIATARAKGEQRAQDVAESVLADSSLESFLNRKASVLMHLQSDGPLSLYEVEEVAHMITENWGADLDLIYGVGQGPCESGELRLGLIVGEYVEDLGSLQETPEQIAQDDPILVELFSKLQSGLSR